MAVHGLQKGQIKRPKQQTGVVERVQAPYKGIDGRVPISMGAQEVCTYTYNLIPDDGGLTVRKGFREWQIEVDAGAGLGVKTVVPFEGLAADGSEDRLFVVTNEGIWDVTTAGAAPVHKFIFATQTDAAGQGVYLAYVTDAGVKTMAYADSVNGLFVYDVATTTWAQATGITGPTITNINFIAVHKQRIWLIEEGASDAWYLGVGAVTGAATKFAFGSKMKTGGSLRGLFSWTVDGGAGVDDMLVGVSASGDVMVYQGADPSAAATWELRGVYFIGNLPAGPKFGTTQGGELFLLSAFGVVSMSNLLKGSSPSSNSSDTSTAAITGFLRTAMNTSRLETGWSIREVPSEGGILIQTPTVVNARPVQFFYNYSVDGWGIWRDLDMTSFGTWRGSVVFGSPDLRVLYMNTTADNVLLTPPAAPQPNATPIEFSILTGFSALNAPALFKRINYIRPDFISGTPPVFSVIPLFDYDSLEINAPLAASVANIAGLWDVSEWDNAIWGGGDEGQGRAYGGFGLGRYVAIALRGSTYAKLLLVGWDVNYSTGGPML